VLIRVLGDVSLLHPDGRAVALPGNRQPALLAALVARAGEVVSADRLVDLLWPGRPPDNPGAALHSAVFKLRVNLARVSGRDLLETRDRGYRLAAETEDVDALLFTHLTQRAASEPAPQAVETLRSALALWQGRAYGSHADGEVAQLDALRLEELRCAAVERYAGALVTLDRPDDAVGVLRPFVAEHPLREEARGWLMRALHAQGRTVDALEQFQAHRRTLADELGIEPSAALRALHSGLLQDDVEPAGRVAPRQRAGGTRPAGLAGLQVRYLDVGGNRIAYGTTGEGPTLLVVLGWVSSLDVIASGRDPRSSLLERLAEHFHLVLYDRAGTGLSPGPVDDYGTDASVAEIEAVAKAVGPPLSLLAMSAAGPLVLRAAHRHPEWVESLVLFGTFADASTTFPDTRLRDMVVELSRSHWGLGSKLLADLYRPGVSDEAAWHLAKVFRDSAEPEVAAAYLEQVYEDDVGHLLADIVAPALVVHYRGDRLVRFAGGRDLAARLPRATFLPLDGGVHLPDARDLDAVEEAVVDHVLAAAGVTSPPQRTASR
jgi:DNA-binding SARP family transcriptional activator/pimeloyl-ACP methyl ester carboxylesterase